MSLSNAVAAETASAPFVIGTGTCKYCDRTGVNCVWVAPHTRGLVSHEKPGEPFVACEAGDGSPPRRFINTQC